MPVHQENTTILNTYMCIKTESQDTWSKLPELKVQLANSIIIVRDFNTLLLIMVRTAMQRINKNTENVNSSINQLCLTDIYRTFSSATAEHTFFSRAQGTLSKIAWLDHYAIYACNKTALVPRIFIQIL